MRSNVQNLALTNRGHEVFAEADFLGHHIKVQCAYHPERQSWVYQVFLVDSTEIRRITELPCALYSSSRMGAVYRGLTLAKRTILSARPAVTMPEDAPRLSAFQKLAVFFRLSTATPERHRTLSA